MYKIRRNLHDLVFYVGIFSAFNLMFFTNVFAEIYVSKRSMKNCFDVYGSDDFLFTRCCLDAATDKLVKEQVKCTPGQYVPQDSTTCAVCDAEPFKNRYFCPGGTFEVPKSIIQGAIACNDGMVTNKTRDGCVKESAGNGNKKGDNSNDRREQSLKEENKIENIIKEQVNQNTSKEEKKIINSPQVIYPADVLYGYKKGNNRGDNSNDRREQSLKEENKIENIITEQVGQNTSTEENKIINLTQIIYNTDVLDYRNVDISKMSEQEACEYWALMNNGEKSGAYWHEETQICVPVGGNLWVAHWNKTQKKFECLNIFDAAEKWHDAQWREEQKSWLESYRKHIYDDKGNLKPAVIGLQWDRNFGKCTSEIERQCLAKGDTYDWFGTCYRHENNKKTCIDIIGGKWKDENGQESCECNIGQYDMLSWTPQKCQYKILLKQENSSTNYIDQQNTGPNKYSDTIPLEYCFEKYKDGFLNNQLSEPKSKLNCK